MINAVKVSVLPANDGTNTPVRVSGIADKLIMARQNCINKQEIRWVIRIKDKLWRLGKKFEVDFGAKAVLNIDSETAMTFLITEKDGKKVNTTETVAINIIGIRSKLFMLTWKEKNGNTIVQLQDHKKQEVYMNWTFPDGKFVQAKGTIKEI